MTKGRKCPKMSMFLSYLTVNEIKLSILLFTLIVCMISTLKYSVLRQLYDRSDESVSNLAGALKGSNYSTLNH